MTGEICSNYTNTSIDHNIENEKYIIKEVAKWIWRIVAPLIFLIGTVGNFGIILIMYRMKFWKKITYGFLVFLAISDTFALCIGLSRQWIMRVFQYDFRDSSDFGCKFVVFNTYFWMHISSWTLVCITIERFLKTRDPFRNHCLNVSRILKCTYLVVILLSIGLDIPLIVTNGLVLTENGLVCNNTSQEYYIYEEKYFIYLDLIWLSLLPFIVMLIMNIFVGRTIRNSIRRRQQFIPDEHYRARHGRTNKRLTRMLFWTSVYFLITTLPISIHNIVDTYLSTTSTPSNQTTAGLFLSRAILYPLQFSNYSVNLYIYIKVKPSFRRFLPGCCHKQELSRRTISQTPVSRSSKYTTQTCLESSITNGASILLSDSATHTEVDTSSKTQNRYLQMNGDSRIESKLPSHEIDLMNLEFLNGVIGTKHNINQPLSNMTTIAALVTGIDVNSQSNDFNQGSTDIDNVVYNHIIESTDL